MRKDSEMITDQGWCVSGKGFEPDQSMVSIGLPAADDHLSALSAPAGEQTPFGFMVPDSQTYWLAAISRVLCQGEIPTRPHGSLLVSEKLIRLLIRS